ncbi:glycosyltransferase family 2 protein [bacterium]|nr:MAG: glycosyltransferase family 2 protein [bacterium]
MCAWRDGVEAGWHGWFDAAEVVYPKGTIWGRMDLSVIVPAYREGPRIHKNLLRLLAELDQLGVSYEVIVVSDGNTDNTSSEVERLGSPQVKVLSYAINKGKGYALGYGVGRSIGRLVTFIDADMELDPRDIRSFIDLMQEHEADIVIGSKRHPLSKVAYPAFRRLESVVYQLLIRVIFNLNVRDTQTGHKLFRREVLADVLPLLAVKRFAFDLELLVVAHHLGYRRVVEAPITLDYQFNSTVRPGAVFSILWDTAAIFYRLRVLRYYDRRRQELLQLAGGKPDAIKGDQI